jgi:ketopantoate reductase
VGAGLRGTHYGVRLAPAGHDVTLIARGRCTEELRNRGAVIEHALTGERESRWLPVAAVLSTDVRADLCLITVRREQLAGALAEVPEVRGISRALVTVNYAGRASELFAHLERSRLVFGFPGAAGSIANGVDR